MNLSRCDRARAFLGYGGQDDPPGRGIRRDRIETAATHRAGSQILAGPDPLHQGLLAPEPRRRDPRASTRARRAAEAGRLARRRSERSSEQGLPRDDARNPPGQLAVDDSSRSRPSSPRRSVEPRGARACPEDASDSPSSSGVRARPVRRDVRSSSSPTLAAAETVSAPNTRPTASPGQPGVVRARLQPLSSVSSRGGRSLPWSVAGHNWTCAAAAHLCPALRVIPRRVRVAHQSLDKRTDDPGSRRPRQGDILRAWSRSGGGKAGQSCGRR